MSSIMCYPKVLKIFTSILVVFLYATGLVGQHYTISTDHYDGNYEVGEEVVFKIASDVSTDVTYVITRGKYTDTLQSGEVDLQSGSTKYVSYKSKEPGAIFIYVKNSWTEGIGGAVIGLDDIALLEEEPADFDSFWTGVKGELQQVPMDAKVNFHKNNDYSKSYTVKLGNIDGRHVYGMLTVPDGDGPFPALVELPAYGDGSIKGNSEFPERVNCLTLSITIHNAPVTQEDPYAYKPNDPTDRDLIYHKHSVTAGIRAIDYLMSRDDFNGTDIGLLGESQGAGLALLIGGIDSRVDLLAIASPALSSHAGLLHGHSSGFPNYLAVPIQLGDPEEIEKTRKAIAYYDAAIAAKRFHGKVFMITSYDDDVASTETQFVATNNLKGEKIYIHNLSGGHNDRPNYSINQRKIIRRYFANTDIPPFPWAEELVGYGVTAGPDKVAVVNEEISLTGKIEKELEVNPAIPVAWRLVSGPGEAVFSDKKAYNTKVVFSKKGVYTLEFKGKDEEFLEEEGYYFILSDQVTINVKQEDNPVPVVTLSTPSEIVNGLFEVTATFSEPVTGLSLDDFNITNGITSNLSGSGGVYTISVEPTSDTISIFLPANIAKDLEGDKNTASNLLSIIYVDESNPKIDLELDLVASNTTVDLNDPITFSLTIWNKGTSIGHAITTNCKIPLGLGFLTANENLGDYNPFTGVWTIDELGVGESAVVTIVARLESSTPVTFFAQVTAAAEEDFDSTPNNNSTFVPQEDDETVEVLTVNSEPLIYCKPSFQDDEEWIRRFKFETVDNLSEKESYADFTSQVAVVRKGIPLDFIIEPRFENNYYKEVYSIWIDYNQDGFFTNEEQVFKLLAPEPTEEVYPILGSIIIPISAKEGMTRMRVVMQRGQQVTEPCGLAEGEVEDYSIFIKNVIEKPKILDFSVSKFLGSAQTDWFVDDVQIGTQFVIQRTTEGDFINLDSIDFSENSNIYNFLDISPEQGMNYYRLKLIDTAGVEEYSSIESLYLTNDTIIDTKVYLFPNLTSGEFNLNLTEFVGRSARIFITNYLGQVLYQENIEEIPGNFISYDINSLNEGLFYVYIKIVGFQGFFEPVILKK